MFKRLMEHRAEGAEGTYCRVDPIYGYSKIHIHASISISRELPFSRKGCTIASVTGKLAGSFEQRWITLGLAPFRNWHP